VGDFEARALARVESTLKYHPEKLSVLTRDYITSPGTMSGGQFDWGGRLPKSNGGARRYPQAEWKPAVECIGIRVLNCKTDMSSRYESRSK
jgi:hypothetical protein